MNPLTPHDKASSAWVRIKQHLEARLVTLRTQNDKTMPEAETENLRGRIAEVKELLALDKDEVTFTE
jgi:hypothetical protein